MLVMPEEKNNRPALSATLVLHPERIQVTNDPLTAVKLAEFVRAAKAGQWMKIGYGLLIKTED